MATILRTLDHEIGRGQIGGEGAIGAKGIDALGDQGAESGFHGRVRKLREVRILTECPVFFALGAMSGAAVQMVVARVRVGWQSLDHVHQP